jgi:hypothetical protein
LQNVFCCVFELPSLRNTRNRDKTKEVEETLTSKFLSFFLENVFDMDFLQKYLYGVFELPLPRKVRKRPLKKKARNKKVDGGWVGLGFSKCTGGSVDFFLAAPRAKFMAKAEHRAKSQEPMEHH